jgi:hypothetical protein
MSYFLYKPFIVGHNFTPQHTLQLAAATDSEQQQGQGAVTGQAHAAVPGA